MPATDRSKSSPTTTPHGDDDDVMEAVRVGIATLTAPWTLEELGASVGADPQSLVPHLDRLLEGGTIVPLGPDPRVDGDEAPMLYGPPPFNDSPN